MHTQWATVGRDVQRFKGDAGTGLVEYALLVSLITLVCVSAVVYFQDATRSQLSKSASAIGEAGK